MDSLKCQTATASPAEPGELPVLLEPLFHGNEANGMFSGLDIVISGRRIYLSQPTSFSRVDLLQRVADRFTNANTFDVKGTASAVKPGSSWRATYEFETQGAQPAFPISL